MTVRFDEAWTAAERIADDAAQRGADVVLVRDILGRASLIVDTAGPQGSLDDLARQLAAAAGPFTGPAPVRRASELFAPDSILDSTELVIRRERTDTHGRLAVLDNRIVGADWTRAASRDWPTRRVAFYGFKGGVGRSTALVMFAKYLAEQGRCVLVCDLDLESPGVSALTHDDDELSSHGLVDHLVEDAVGNAVGLNLVSRSRRFTGAGNGEIWLAPAAGRPRAGYDYLAKLNRVYTDAPPLRDGESARSFAERLRRAISACEAEVSDLSRVPDIVLLDSRAGIHDVAAVALTQLSDFNFLFASDSPQTWRGYGELFAQWNQLAPATNIGSRLKLVSALTPEAFAESYLRRFRDRAQSLFESLYEETDPTDLDSFNFSVDDPDAPHYPLPILFHSDLVSLDPTGSEDWHSRPFVEAAFRDFLESASNIVRGLDD
ncbi:AAA family ATPase [Saccharomonospora xinjiangensis]|uniref:KGGVGR-motif variant AAA ATPase n=1 Tax=Saccharomonospora xinjiangensis TaxID=75294 RepID=UPI0010706204|nr:AAA family ATPase [Saccharomonospora xinjiangensis]QBQ58983.1 CobQ/CobB/MinD/ParA nucleotide binding domain protein [Saccharomonospora xinjiangensis]